METCITIYSTHIWSDKSSDFEKWVNKVDSTRKRSQWLYLIMSHTTMCSLNNPKQIHIYNKDNFTAL